MKRKFKNFFFYGKEVFYEKIFKYFGCCSNADVNCASFWRRHTSCQADSGNAIVKIMLPQPDANHNLPTYNVGDIFYVNAVISNPTNAVMSDSAVLNPGATAHVLDDASKTVSVPAYGTVDVWWRLQCIAGGDSTITVTYGNASDSVTVHQVEQFNKKLIVTILEARLR